MNKKGSGSNFLNEKSKKDEIKEHESGKTKVEECSDPKERDSKIGIFSNSNGNSNQSGFKLNRPISSKSTKGGSSNGM